MKELVVISGKGGTGKTSVVASFAILARNAVLADCDVDAADLHLVLNPTIRQRNDFTGGKKARIVPGRCVSCGKCQTVCRFNAISAAGPSAGGLAKTYVIDRMACEGCGVCVHVCRDAAIAFETSIAGQWFASETRCGTMIHAKLGVAAENSGKLVSIVRSAAKATAEEQSRQLVIVDGPPGIGCPVIASITGADMVLVITEPTLSGMHDLDRVAELTRHFGIPTFVCVNKWDINPEMTRQIENKASADGLTLAGRLRYDQDVTRAQVRKQAVVEYADTGVSQDMKTLWATISSALKLEKT
ncbi:MAG: (4Fe-4S)-binding protein [Planctomycetaceae bacterium]|nr:MAG: (4Fe-4S)-binding protein [Planctomycetaceae bacterium]